MEEWGQELRDVGDLEEREWPLESKEGKGVDSPLDPSEENVTLVIAEF